MDPALPYRLSWQMNIKYYWLKCQLRENVKASILTFGLLVTFTHSDPAAAQTANAGRETTPKTQSAKPVQSPPTGQQSGTTLARTTFIQLMDADFKQRDFDNDGKATRAEVERFEKQNAVAKAQQTNRELFIRLDTDRNGFLSPIEFAGLIPPAGFPDVSDIMKRFDSNRDQIITRVEYRAATLSNFDQRDIDKDGVLSGSELQTGSVAAKGAESSR